MKIETSSYDSVHGWTAPPQPEMDSIETLVLVFGASDLRDDPRLLRALAELRSAYPRSAFLGCSTAGEIQGTQIRDGSLAVAVARFERSRLVRASSEVAGAGDSFEAGRRIATELAGPALRAVLVLSPGVNVNGSELVRGINSVLPAAVVVTGGLAGDGSRFARTWVLGDHAPSEGRVSAVGFAGERVGIAHGSLGGWDIFGPERSVTRSTGNVLYELDGKPALALYKHYLGDQAEGLPATALLYPLALRASRTDPKTLVRTVLAVDAAESSLTFAGDIPQGSRVQLMRANFDRLIEGAAGAGRATRAASALDRESLAVAVSCVGRRLVLGERTEEEVEAAVTALPPDARLVGFYSYGEISPFASGACDLHNQTMTLTNLWED